MSGQGTASVTTGPLRARARRRARDAWRRQLLRWFGRPVLCTECGEDIGRAISYVRRGRVRVLGLEFQNVRVSFSAQEELSFRHLELDRCPAPGREWARR